jgi:redox-regulated HSP33 family molecular chaperone
MQADEVYDAVQQWNGISQEVPVLLQRMETLQQLHTQSANFNQRLLAIEQSQASLSMLVQQSQQQLDTVVSHA